MPNYKATIKMHLPTDPPFRDKPEDVTDEVKMESPQGLWRSVIMKTTGRLRMDKDVGFLVGLILNLVNPFPTEVRMSIVTGIIHGLGFRYTVEEDLAIAMHLDPMFVPLEAPEADEVVQMPDGSTGLVRESGLVVPV